MKVALSSIMQKINIHHCISENSNNGIVFCKKIFVNSINGKVNPEMSFFIRNIENRGKYTTTMLDSDARNAFKLKHLIIPKHSHSRGMYTRRKGQNKLPKTKKKVAFDDCICLTGLL